MLTAFFDDETSNRSATLHNTAKRHCDGQRLPTSPSVAPLASNATTIAFFSSTAVIYILHPSFKPGIIVPFI
jgi:hypothetical protein